MTQLKKMVIGILMIMVLLAWSAASASGTDPVAKIGDVGYATLQDAINNAKSGDQIVMVKDTMEDIFIPGYDPATNAVRTDKPTLTLDLDGHTLTSANDYEKQAAFVHISGGATVTMKNGTLTGARGQYYSELNSKGKTVWYGKKYAMYLGDTVFTGEKLTFKDNDAYMGNSYTKTGGAVYMYLSSADPITGVKAAAGKATFKECTFDDNAAYVGAGAIYAGSTSSYSLEMEIEKCNFTGNQGDSYGAMYFSSSNANSSLKITDTTVEKNTVTKINGGHALDLSVTKGALTLKNVDVCNNFVGAAKLSSSKLDVDTCNFNGNVYENKSSGTVGVYFGSGSGTVKNSRIANNECTSTNKQCYGGAYFARGSNIVLSNTVITGNKGPRLGGVFIYQGAVVTMDPAAPGAIYGNITTQPDDYVQEHDIAQMQWGNELGLVAADKMVDGDFDFTNYRWVSGVDSYKTGITEKVTKMTFYSAEYVLERDVAKIERTGEVYTSLELAVANAAANDVITIVAGESDGTEKTVRENITIDKALTIDLNGRTLTASRGNTLTISSTGGLILQGKGAVSATDGVSIVNNGSLTFDTDASASIGAVTTSTSNVLIKSNAVFSDITLAKNCTLSAESDVDAALKLYVDSSIVTSVNKGTENISHVLIKTSDGHSLSAFAGKVSVEGINKIAYLSTDTNGNVVVCGRKLEGIFLDGIRGDDANDGLSRTTPVKTFEKAKALLAASSYHDIYVVGMVTVSDNVTWSLSEGDALVRHTTYTDAMVKVTGTLTLKDIIIDGNGENIAATNVGIYVSDGAVLNIRDGAVIKDHCRNKSSDGGAIFCAGTLDMSGGEVSGNRADYGAGIMVEGDNASFALSGGLLTGNTTNKNSYGDFQGDVGGAAVLVAGNADMIMTGGTITGNSSQYAGGGIAVGYTGKANVGEFATLTMKGGTISNNYAPSYGGGLYVQFNGIANISAGQIINNSSAHEGRFAGGGIYVNGGNTTSDLSFDNGKLYLTNAIITGNSAGAGGGYAGCETSMSIIQMTEGAAIYGNTSAKGKDISFRHGASVGVGGAAASISEYMLGGGAYNWKDDFGETVPANLLNDGYYGFIDLNSNPTAAGIEAAEKLGKVTITGNVAKGFGGGIASNGNVYIGVAKTDGESSGMDIPVTKVWIDDNCEEKLIERNGNYYLPVENYEAETIHPQSFRVWLLRDGERVSNLTFSVSHATEDGVVYRIWPKQLKFVDQPTGYTYTLEEEVPAGYKNISVVTGDASSGFIVTNYYNPTVNVTLEATKTVEGATPTEEFAFTLTGEGQNQSKTTVNGVATFDTLVFDMDDIGDTFTYTIQEGAVNTSVYVKDPSVFTVEIKISTNTDGTLAVQKTVKKDGTEVTSGEIVFDNKYYRASGELILTASKLVNGAAATEEQVFTFELTQDGTTYSDVKQNVAGTVTFNKITYSEADVGKTYTYTVKETAPDGSGYTADKAVYSVTVVISDNGDGTLKVDATYARDGVAAESIVFSNVYEASNTLQLVASKMVNGAVPSAEEEGKFSFELSGESITTQTKTNGAGGVVSFDPIAYTLADVGKTYTYTMKETTPDGSGYTADKAVYSVTVVISDNGDGTLKVDTTYARDGVAAESIVFSNVYAASNTLQLVASKTVNGAAPAEGEVFAFTLSEGNTMLQTVNNQGGQITFAPIEYTLAQVGTHLYTVKEVAGDNWLYTYDDTIYTVTVNVTDGGDGKLKVTQSISDGTSVVNAIAFANTCITKGGIRVVKADSRDLTVKLQGAVYSVYTDKNCTAKVGDMLTDAKGEGSLQGLEPGAYYVKETTAPEGYDLDPTVYEVTVEAGKTTPVDEANDGIVVNDKLASLTLIKADRTNPSKLLAGAVYGVYSDAECKLLAGKVLTGADGSGMLFGLRAGLYYVKEIQAPVGYDIDPQAYPVQVGVGAAQTTTVTDPPLVGVLRLSKTAEAVDGAQDSFEFTVKLTADTADQLSAFYPASLNGQTTEPVKFTISSMTAEATVFLKSGDVMELHGLREGLRYTVTEKADLRYAATVNGVAGREASGAISQKAPADVVFENVMETTSLTIEKVWQGSEGGPITLTVYANGVAMEPQPACTRKEHTYTYDGLQRLDEKGNAIIYTVKEKPVDGYMTVYENAAPNQAVTDCAYHGGRIVNKALMSVAVRKVWSGLAEGEARPAITLTLQCNGAVYPAAMPEPDADGWYIYSKLPPMVDGKDAVYSVVEEPVTGYTTIYENTGIHASATDRACDGGTIINQKIPQTGDGESLGLWMMLMTLTLGGLILLQVKRRGMDRN